MSFSCAVNIWNDCFKKFYSQDLANCQIKEDSGEKKQIGKETAQVLILTPEQNDSQTVQNKTIG